MPATDPDRTTSRDVPLIAIDLSPDAAGIDVLHGAVAAIWDALRQRGVVPAAEWRNEFATALGEIASNIIRHSVRPSSSPTPFRLACRLTGDALVASFENRGVPFHGTIPNVDPVLPGNEAIDGLFDLPEGSFGLALARRSLDDLRYEYLPDDTNRWLLTKRLPA